MASKYSQFITGRCCKKLDRNFINCLCALEGAVVKETDFHFTAPLFLSHTVRVSRVSLFLYAELKEAQKRKKQLEDRCKLEESIGNAALTWSQEILPNWQSM